MVESVRWRRLRWRLRGAWQWPAFIVLTIVDARPRRPAAVPGRGDRRDRRVPGRGLLQPARGRAAGAGVRDVAAPPPARPAVHDRPRLRGHGAARADHVRAARGRADPSLGGGRGARRPARGVRRRPRLRRRRPPRGSSPAWARWTRVRLETDQLPRVRAGPGEAPALPVRQHRPVTRGRHARPLARAERPSTHNWTNGRWTFARARESVRVRFRGIAPSFGAAARCCGGRALSLLATGLLGVRVWPVDRSPATAAR